MKKVENITLLRRCTYALSILVCSIFLSNISQAQLTTVTTPDINRCVAGSNQLLTTPSGGTSYSYSWTPAAGLSSVTISNPVASPTTTTTYYVTVTDIPTSNTVTDSVTITIQNIPPPIAVFPQSDTICQGDTLPLTVVNDPFCTSVPGSCQSPSSLKTVGSGTFFAFQSADNPFFKTNTFFQQVRSAKHQYIFTAEELNAFGLTGPTTISSIAWDFTVNFGSHTYTNITLSIGCTTDSVMSSTFKTGLSSVFGPSSRTFNSTQWEQFTFSQPYVWDGTSNLVLEVCYSNNSASNGFPLVRINTSTTNVAGFAAANSNVCGNTAASLTNRRPNTRFFHCDVAHNSTLSYSWTPAAGLSSSSVRNPTASPATTTSYILTATDNNGCVGVDTAVVNVAPLFNLSINSDTSLCEEDTIPLAASHTGGAGASFKWSALSWIEDDTLQNTRAFFNQDDWVYVDVKSQLGCEISDSFRVDLVSPVEVDILSEDTNICSGDTLPILVSTNSQNCATYSNIACNNPGNLLIASTSAFPSGGVTISPFDGLATLTTPGQKKQYLFTATEFAAIVNTNTISKLGFNLQSTGSATTTRNGFTIKMGCTSVSSFPFGSSNFITGLQTVFTPKTINISTGWNDFNFDDFFVWDGVSNVVVEICWQNSSSLGFGFSTLNWSTSSFNSVLVNWNNPTFCSSTSGTFSTTFRPEMRFGFCSSPPNPAFQFQWTPSTALSSDTVAEPFAFPSTQTTYILNVVDPSSGCSDSDTITINTAPDFNTSVTNDTILCSSDSVQLNVSHNSVSPVTYNWSPFNQVSDSSISNPWVYVNGLKTIVSEVRSNMGCIKWDTVNLGLHDQLDLSIIPPTGLSCEGDSLQFDSQVNLACGQSYSNLCSATSTLTLGNSTTTSSAFNVTPFVASNPSSKKQYLLRKSELNNAGATGSIQLSSISFEITALGKTDYENFTIKMGCTSSNSLGTNFLGGGVVVFEPKDITLTSGKNWFDFDYRFNWDGTTNVFVEICYTNSGTGSNSEVLYTIPSPIFNCTEYRRGNSVCNFGTGTAYNRRPNIEFRYCSVATTNYNYSWSPQNWFNDPGISNPKAIANVPSWYRLDLIDPASNCITTDSVQVDVMSFEINATEDTSLCSTEDFQLNVNTTAVQPKYLWTPGNQVSNDTIRNPRITVDNGLVYIVEVTDSAGCIKWDTVDITLLPRPTANANPNSIDVCRFSDVQLSGSGGNTYEWSPGNLLNDSTIPSPLATVEDTTIFYLKVTNALGCSDVDSAIVNVFPSPILDLGPDTSYCNGGWIVLDAGPGFNSYLWQDNSKQQSLLVESDGKFWVSVEDAFACKFSDTVNIGVAPSPEGDFSLFTDLCVGDSVILDAMNPGSSYLWSTGETSRQIIVKDSGFFWVEINDGTCVGKDSTIISVYEYPVTYLSDVEYYCEKETPFGMTLQAGPDEYSYLWSTGQRTPSIIVDEPGDYSVEITNGGKCLVLVETEVKLLCGEKIWVPNTFTPNNDWKNDKLSITATNMDEFEFRIFNRWGEVIFYSTDPDFEWDGRSNGHDVPSGAYVWRMDYKIRVSDGTFENREARGSITILR